MKERWIKHTVYTDYEISDYGRVRRIAGAEGTWAGRILSGSVHPRTGYVYVTLNGTKSERVHRLVLETFNPKPSNDLETRHLDGDKTNNRLSNLSWGTSRQNYDDQIKHGVNRHGALHGRSLLSDSDVLNIRGSYKKNVVTHSMLAKKYGVTVSCISHIVSRHNWRHI